MGKGFKVLKERCCLQCSILQAIKPVRSDSRFCLYLLMRSLSPTVKVFWKVATTKWLEVLSNLLTSRLFSSTANVLWRGSNPPTIFYWYELRSEESVFLHRFRAEVTQQIWTMLFIMCFLRFWLRQWSFRKASVLVFAFDELSSSIFHLIFSRTEKYNRYQSCVNFSWARKLLETSDPVTFLPWRRTKCTKTPDNFLSR
jgi:hypothetical protein